MATADEPYDQQRSRSSRVDRLVSSSAGIEMYFDALKNGCKVASLQLRMLPRLEVVLALFMIVAWRINPAIILTALTVVVDRLPKTRSDKVLRATMIQLASGEDYKGPPSIDDPEILSELARSLDPMGYPIH